MIKGVLFDMDGVLVDTEVFLRTACVMLFEELGLKVEHDDFMEFTGAGEDRFIGGVAEKYNFPIDLPDAKARAYEIYSEIVKGKLKSLPGVNSFLAKCKEKNLKTALATSADKTKMDINLREIGLSADDFNTVVNGLDVERKKPFPDIYIKAAKLIGTAPSNCLVVEDAVTGVEAAKKAGAKCLGLTTSFSRKELAGADWFAQSLADAPEEVLEW